MRPVSRLFRSLQPGRCRRLASVTVRRTMTVTAAGALGMACLSFIPATPVLAQAQAELNALVWCNHTDDSLIEPFERANDVQVNLRELRARDDVLTLLQQAQPGDWDVLVVDTVDVPRLAAAGVLAPLPADALPVDDLWPQVRLADDNTLNGRTYGITELFGYHAIAYNRERVDPDDMQYLTRFWSGRYRERIAVYDWALPAIGLVGLGLNRNPAALGMQDMPAIRETLGALAGNAIRFTDAAESQAALADGDVDILFGAGEWMVAALATDRPELDWTLPREGGLLWTMSAAQVAGSRQSDLALKFIRHLMSPAGQAALATSSCYWSLPANRKAAAYLDARQRRILRWRDQPEFLSRAYRFPEPDTVLEQVMDDAWTDLTAR